MHRRTASRIRTGSMAWTRCSCASDRVAIDRPDVVVIKIDSAVRAVPADDDPLLEDPEEIDVALPAQRNHLTTFAVIEVAVLQLHRQWVITSARPWNRYRAADADPDSAEVGMVQTFPVVTRIRLII